MTPNADRRRAAAASGSAGTLNAELLAQLGEPGIEQVAGLLDADPDRARGVLTAVSGAIVGGMLRNAAHPDGAEALRGALDDHVDADPFNGDVASLSRDGQSILGHVFGGTGSEHVADELARIAGADQRTIMKLMQLVAPMVMSLLAVRAARGDLDSGALAESLQEEYGVLPGRLGELIDGLLSDIFGDPAEPGSGQEAYPGRPDLLW